MSYTMEYVDMDPNVRIRMSSRKGPRSRMPNNVYPVPTLWHGEVVDTAIIVS